MAKILLVDDEPDILFTLRLSFEQEGHEVIATQHPREVLALVESEAPDALLLDIMMPEMSGWEVLAELRRRPEHRALPVVLLTALHDTADRVRGLRAGADDYQLKPFEPEELLARVEGLIARRPRPPVPSRELETPAASTALTASTASTVPAGAEPLALEAAIAELEQRIADRQPLDEISLGRYEVSRVLGSGAMGTVFRGWDPKLRRPVALKTIRFNSDPRDRQRQISRLQDEAIAGARSNHPNIVTVYDFADEGNAAFIAMELIDGISLETHLAQSGPIAAERLMPLAAAVASALTAAHEHDLIHRDVKPGNILLGRDGSIKVTDFGICELITQATAGGSIFGTPGYLAPECLCGEAASPASDLFALGVVLYESLSGVHPFIANNWRRTLHNTVMSDPEPIEELVPGVPPRLGALIHQLLAKEEAERPASAAELAQTLTEVVRARDLCWTLEETGPASAPPAAGSAAPSRPHRSSRLVATRALTMQGFTLQPAPA